MIPNQIQEEKNIKSLYKEVIASELPSCVKRFFLYILITMYESLMLPVSHIYKYLYSH